MTQTQSFDHPSPRDVALGILDRLEERHDIGLRQIIFSETLSLAEKKERLTTRLFEAILEDLARQHAEDGRELPFDPDGDELHALAAAAEGEVEVEPNLVYREADALRIRGYQGDQLESYLSGLAARLEPMSRSSSPHQLAGEIVAAGLVSVGIPMAAGTAKALAGGAKPAAAVEAGITGIGMTAALRAVASVMMTFLLFQLLSNPKKILGMVFNDSDESWVVQSWRRGVGGDKGADLFLQQGVMVTFPEDTETGKPNSPKVQIRKRYFFAPGDANNLVCAGLFFANRNVGYQGSEGIMVLSASGTSPAVALLFAVPYSKDNGTNIQVLSSRPSPSSLPDSFRSLYDSRQARVDRTENGYRVVSTVNPPRGGVVALIAAIQKV